MEKREDNREARELCGSLMFPILSCNLSGASHGGYLHDSEDGSALTVSQKYPRQKDADPESRKRTKASVAVMMTAADSLTAAAGVRSTQSHGSPNRPRKIEANAAHLRQIPIYTKSSADRDTSGLNNLQVGPRSAMKRQSMPIVPESKVHDVLEAVPKIEIHHVEHH
ncbi:hypothetical protein CH63R_13340 [Colletotrichum higginsianum IMI 349063]|uniref:Uncharacterized protein n=1 Tax=Colletotrichum higginsianum (strain IMI 349063) TaxID=759273 RepID=A0A1B7XWR7_COLHI|nr:hypothetical protein CH63R_13340 [Colletotrichum higginsianum IMI 349063]OBR04213.1 hypothetical protein CH63R_13340 [Colletotrichum higginsianum IMI 349063]